jgi:hypothetical protein
MTKPASGKWVQRIPRSLHARLQMIAAMEGVSLNHLVLCVLAASVGSYQVSVYPESAQQDKQAADTEPAKENNHD